MLLRFLLFCNFTIFLTAYTSHSCFNGCTTCQIVYIFMFCTECAPNRTFNPDTGLCDCPSNNYDSGTECFPCPNFCQTCTSHHCTSCTNDKYLDVSGYCLCLNGQNLDSNGNCPITSVTNVALIVGATLGSFSLLSCIITILYVIRNRKIKIFDNSQMASNRQVQYNGMVVQQMAENNSAINMFVNHKYTFKDDEICCICLDYSAIFMTPCGHYFHHHCISAWLGKKKSCPNCNQTVTTSQIVKWCQICKKELIYPQRSRYKIISKKHQNSSQIDSLIFDSTCSDCQQIDEIIELKQIPCQIQNLST